VKKEMSVEKVERKAIPIKGLILGLLLMPLGILTNPWLDASVTGVWFFAHSSPHALLTFPLGALFIFVAISYLIALATGKGLFSLDDYIVATTLMLMGFSAGGFLIQLSGQVHFAPSSYPYIVEKGWVPSYWAPSVAASKSLLSKTAIDWGAFAGPFMYWSLVSTAFMLVVASMPMIFLEQWVSVESLSFPLQSAFLTAMETDENRKPKLFANKIFWAGFIVSIIVNHFGLVQIFFPAYPSISWPSWSLLSSLKMPISVSTHPTTILFFLLFPTKVILTTVVAVFLQWGLIPAVAMSTGIVPDISAQGSWPVTWLFWGSTEQSTFRWLPFGGGMSIGIALFAIYLARGHLKRVISEALSKPMAQPWVWTFLIGLIALLLLEIIPGVDIVYILITFVWMLLAWLGYSKMSAEAPMFSMCWHNISFAWSIDYFTKMGMNNTPLAWKSMTLGTHVNAYPCGSNQGVTNFTTTPLATGYYGKKTGISVNTLFWVIIVGGILAVFISWPLYTYVIGKIGPTDYFQWWYTRWVGIGVETGTYEVVAIPGQVLWTFLGVVFAIILEFMSITYPWWPISTATWAITVIYQEVGQPLIALVVKYLLLRTYGTKANDYIIPFVLGYLTFAAFLYLILWFPSLVIAGRLSL